MSGITSIAVKFHINEITPSDLFLLIMLVLNTLFRNCDRTQKFLKSHKQYYNLSLSEGGGEIKKEEEEKEKMELAHKLLGRAAVGSEKYYSRKGNRYMLCQERSNLSLTLECFGNELVTIV